MKLSQEIGTELKVGSPKYYRVKRGQTVSEIADAFRIPLRLLCAVNGTERAEEGQVLSLPPAGDLYTVRGGESKTMLCGSPARYFERNGTNCLYPGQIVSLG